MIDVHGMANAAIQIVNNDKPGYWIRSIGYTVNEDGTQEPKYSVHEITAQVQPVAHSLVQSYGLNMDSPMKSIYIRGDVRGIRRRDETGGDLVAVDGDVYKVVTVSESWPTWTHVIGDMQLDEEGDFMALIEELEKRAGSE